MSEITPDQWDEIYAVLERSELAFERATNDEIERGLAPFAVLDENNRVVLRTHYPSDVIRKLNELAPAPPPVV